MARGRLNEKTKYNTELIERLFGVENDLYQTREELQAWEEKHWKVINWELWDKLVQQSKAEIEKLLAITPSASEPKLKCRPFKTVYVYNYDGQLVGRYFNATEAAKTLNVAKSTISYCSAKCIPHLTERLYYSYQPLDVEQVKERVKPYLKKKIARKTNGKRGVPSECGKWVYDLEGNFIGHFLSTDEIAQKFNITRSSVNYYSWMNKPYKKKGIFISNQPININNLEKKQ